MQKVYKGSDITIERLKPYFHLPIADAARELGVCPTLLKNICRDLGLPRWPYRQIRSLTNMIDKLNTNTTESGDREIINSIIQDLEQKRRHMLEDPTTYHDALYQERKDFRSIYKKYAKRSPDIEESKMKFVGYNVPQSENRSNTVPSHTPQNLPRELYRNSSWPTGNTNNNNNHNHNHYSNTFGSPQPLEPKINVQPSFPYLPFKW